MAKIVSPVWSSARGSIAGTTYLTTPSGQIIARQRTRPVQAPSNNRTWVRDALTQGATRWSALLAPKRAQWNTWAIANPPGSGRQQFVAGQSVIDYIVNASLNGVTVVLDDFEAPAFSGHASFTLAPATFTIAHGTGIAFKIRNTSPVDCWFLCELSPQLAPTRNFWKGPWDAVYLRAQRITAGTTQTFQQDTLVDLARYFVRVRAVTDGISTVPPVHGRVVSSSFIVHTDAITVP